MKKINLTLGVVVLFSVLLSFSSFSTSNSGNGNVVTIDNGQTWIWIADNCSAPWVYSTSARVQSATNGFFSADVDFQLPDGHCDIPAKGAKVTHYNDNSWSIVNSNGKVQAKILFRPNDN